MDIVPNRENPWDRVRDQYAWDDDRYRDKVTGIGVNAHKRI